MKLIVKFAFLLGCLIPVKCVHFEVDNGLIGSACILMDIDATFNLTYADGRKKEEAQPFTIDGASADSTSKCGLMAPLPILSIRLFPSSERLMFSFFQQNGTKILMAGQFTLQPNKHFKGLNTTETVELNNLHQLPIGDDSSKSYLCKAEETMTFASGDHFFMKMSIRNLHVQAYKIIGSTFSPATGCYQDLTTSTLSTKTTTEPPLKTTSPQPESSTEPNTSTEITTLQTESTTNGNSTSEIPSKMSTEWTPETTMVSTQEPTTQKHIETTTESHSSATSVPQQFTTEQTRPTSEPKTETTTRSTPETTTKPPYESTTSARADTSTVPEIETTASMPPSTTQSPNTQHKYVVRDNDKVCIVLQADMTFDIPFQKTDGTTSKASVPLPDDVRVNGNCNVNNSGAAQEITLTFFNTSWYLDVIIAKKRHNSLSLDNLAANENYSWQKVILSYVLDSHFENATDKGKRLQVTADETFGIFQANADGSFKCTAEKTIEFGKDKKIKLDLSKLKYRAFGKTNSTDISNTDVSECPEDNKNKKGSSHKTLGIALGCSFAALVVIVFVACGVKRYRKKNRKEEPYETL